MTRRARIVAATLLAALGASQAALVVLNPVLPSIADDLDVSIATAGQLRTISGLVAGLTALAAGLLAARIGLRELLGIGLAILAVGSLLSAVAPGFPALAATQAFVGAGIGVSYSVAVAAAAEWATPEERSRVLSIALLGPPLAWIVGMPIVGIVGERSWRLAWIVVPFLMALAAGVLLLRRPSTPPAKVRAALHSVLRETGVVRWSAGELLAFSGWAGTLVFAGALFIESYDLSIAATGFVLGFAALIYLPGNLLFRRWVDEHDRVLLIVLALASAAIVVIFGAVRVSLWLSIVLFSTVSFISGGRTLAGSVRSLHLAPTLRLGVTGVRTAALQFGYFVGPAVGGTALGAAGYTGLGLALGALFVAGTIPHLLPSPSLR
jgi:MFS transporter, DHA1 family, inner membrane transport protein